MITSHNCGWARNAPVNMTSTDSAISLAALASENDVVPLDNFPRDGRPVDHEPLVLGSNLAGIIPQLQLGIKAVPIGLVISSIGFASASIPTDFCLI
ncbi:hypothetical protein VNO77_26803 [Canavalia gladiata]|uniref:Uncharacterized protein n=1 Tax=Canavalia gladiata TaxID=3824 RepID=A0AAN9KXP8_CANGL